MPAPRDPYYARECGCYYCGGAYCRGECRESKTVLPLPKTSEVALPVFEPRFGKVTLPELDLPFRRGR